RSEDLRIRNRQRRDAANVCVRKRRGAAEAVPGWPPQRKDVLRHRTRRQVRGSDLTGTNRRACDDNANPCARQLVRRTPSARASCEIEDAEARPPRSVPFVLFPIFFL